jgi:uracil-DNA glycosylase
MRNSHHPEIKPTPRKFAADSGRFFQRLLYHHWRGNRLITLGNEAFRRFRPSGDSGAFRPTGADDAQFEAVFHCHLSAEPAIPSSVQNDIPVHPLSHPSPLNRRWHSRFPALLAQRLVDVCRHTDDPRS